MASGLSTSPIQATARIVARTLPRSKHRADAPEQQHDGRDDGERQQRGRGVDRQRPFDSGLGADAHRAIVGDRCRREAAAEAGRQRHQLKRDRDEREDEREIQPSVRAAPDGGSPEQGEQGDAARQRHHRQEIGMGECEERPADEQDEHA